MNATYLAGTPLNRTHVTICLLLGGICLLGHTHLEAAPQITGISIRGLQIGGTTELSIQGKDLLPNPRLLLPGIPIAKQELLDQSSATNVRMAVTLDSKVPAGLHNLRLFNRFGVSPAVPIAVDKLPQRAMTEKITSLPVALHGVLAGSTVNRCSFSGKKGQPLLIEVEAQRLGGKLRPVIHLLDGGRREIKLALPSHALAGDARLETELPADGQYTIEVHDLQYAAPAPGFYRLKVGAFVYADFTFPLAIQRGTSTALQLLGNGADQKVTVSAPAHGSWLAAPWPENGIFTGCRPRIAASDFPELVEQASAGEKPEVQQLPEPPVAISGRLDAAEQVDRYRVPVTPGRKLRFQIMADRIGSPIDSVLEIHNDKDAVLTQNDDADGSADSRIDYTPVKDQKWVDVAIRDQSGSGTWRSVYRLVVTRLDQPGRPGFSLRLSTDAQSVRASSTTVFRIEARRDRYDGPIQIEMLGLPKGIKAVAPQIPAGNNSTLLTIAADGTVSPASIVRIRGRSIGLNPPIETVAAFDTHPLAKIQPWLTEELAVATAEPNRSALQVAWGNPEIPLVLGTTIKAPLSFKRPPGEIGPIRVSLITSQLPPLVKGKPSPALAVRAAKATIDLPLDPKAKAAFDTLAAADKVFVESRQKFETANKAAQAKIAESTKILTQATAAKTTATAAVAAALARFNSAERAQQQSQQDLKLATAVALAADQESQAAADARLNQTVANLRNAQKIYVAAAAQLKTASTSLLTSDAGLAAATRQADAVRQSTAAGVQPLQTAFQQATERRNLAEKALRDAEDKLPSRVEFPVIVPPNLAIKECDVALKVELRSLDNKILLAEVFTPVRRLVAVQPLEVSLAKSDVTTTPADKSGGVAKITGKIQRKFGFAGDVTLTIAGLPKGVTAPKSVLKPGNDDFNLEIKFPEKFKPTELKGLKVTAVGPPDPKNPKVTVQRQQVVNIKVAPAKS